MSVCRLNPKHRASLAKKHWFLVQLTHFLVSQTPRIWGDKFKKSSNKSRKAYFIPPCHLLVFVSQLDSSFAEKDVKNNFFTYLLYIYMEKTCKNTCLGVILVCSPAFRTLRLRTKHYILILCEQWKNHIRGISKKSNIFSRATLIGLASDWYYKTLFESKSTERANMAAIMLEIINETLLEYM